MLPLLPLIEKGILHIEDTTAGDGRWYAGIGSSDTPDAELELIVWIAQRLACHGWGLRSGGARGADTAFERGALEQGGPTEIFLPELGYASRIIGIDASALPCAERAAQLAESLHPRWHRQNALGRRLITRNVHQVLGADLESPVSFVLCWALGSIWREDQIINVSGGTGLAVRLAATRGIPVFNLCVPEHRQRIEHWLGSG